MQGFSIDTRRPIGHGSFGQVFQGVQRKNNQLVAVKQVKFNMFAEGIPGLGLREISNLGTVTHKHIAKLIYADVSLKGSVNIVMEYVDMDLHRYIKVVKNNNESASLPEPLIQRLSRHLFKGLAHLHMHRIIHRDIKPGNILIDSNQCLKIADLGLSRIHAVPCVPMSFEATTLAYRAPDIILGERVYTTAFDMWSAGCVVAEMARAGDTLFRCRSLNLDQQLEEIFKNLGTPDEEIWPGVSKLPGWKEFEHWEPRQAVDLLPGLSVNGMDLILQCLFYPACYRISAARALLHPWLNKHVPHQFPEKLASYYLDPLM